MKRLLFTVLTLALCVGSVARADEMVAETQRLLHQLEFDAGTIDGVWGNKTSDALAAFLQTQGIEFDGDLTDEHIAQLRAAADELFVPAEPNIADRNRSAYSQRLISRDLSQLVSQGADYFGYTHVPQIDINSDGHLDTFWFDAARPSHSLSAKTMLWATDFDGFDFIGGITEYPEIAGYIARHFVADFSGSGRQDIFMAGSGDWGAGNLTLMTNNGDGTLSSSKITDGFFHDGAVGDLNGDGHIDFVTQEGQSQRIICGFNDGNGNFTLRTCLNLRDSFGRFSVADFNNDGHSDIALVPNLGVYFAYERPRQIRDIAIVWGDGTGSFDRRNMSTIDMSRYRQDGEIRFYSGQLTTVDINDDQRVDLVVALEGAGAVGSAVALYENVGHGDFEFRSYLYQYGLFKSDPELAIDLQNESLRLGSEYGPGNAHITEHHVHNGGCGNVTFVDINEDGQQDFVCSGVGKDGEPDENYTGTLPPHGYSWRWSALNTYAVLDGFDVVDSGKIFNQDQTAVSPEFAAGGYSIGFINSVGQVVTAGREELQSAY